ncbi:MAG: prolyl oligopeptidase family serine peptidase [Xanthomonadales bacterium]|nr:S9 family peptidase [Xanthomonadales bacterium]NIX11993.1 prolyl oligopeptidase family serine peptidase [Xanthomonadales bacterium]
MKSCYLAIIALWCGVFFVPDTRADANDAAATPLTLEEIVTLKRVRTARLSPNGDAIAYLLTVPRALYEDEDGDAWVQLQVVDLEGVSRPYFTGKVDVSEVAWSHDGNDLFFVARRDPDAPHRDIWRMPLDGGDAVLVHEAQGDIDAIYPSPDGTRLAFLATDPDPAEKEELADLGFKALVYEESKRDVRVWMLDLESSTVTARELSGSASEFAWAPDGRQYAVALAPTPLVDDDYISRDIFVIDAETASVINPLGSVGKLGGFAWSPDGTRIAYIAGEDIHDPSPGRLYVSSRGGGERNELVPGYDGQVESFYWVDDGRIAYLGSRGVLTEFTTVSLDRPAAPAEAPPQGPVLRSLHSMPGQRIAAAVADTPGHPPEVYLLTQGGEPRRLTDSNPILGERVLARQEAITYRARDGLELDAVVIHPTTPPPEGGSPLIVFAHGGPEGHYSNGWMSTYSRPGQALAGQGYAVVYPNYRGSTGRGVTFSKMGQHAYAGPEFDDLVDAKQHLVEAGLADPDRTGISGGSYGGYASMWAASALTEHFAAAVAFVGISNQLSKFGTGDIP